MDILKVLSRGIKQPQRSSSSSSTVGARLPSAGAAVHPQLFHDNVGPPKGNKRKRKRQVLEKDEEPDFPELDFFATTTKADHAESSAESKPAVVEDESQIDGRASQPKLRDEDECRQLLRSHRLKITHISDAKNSKKRSPTGSKNEKRQLFPQPLTSFAELQSTYGIVGQVSANLAKESYRIPTEVQMGALPLLLRPELALSAATDPQVPDGINLMAVAPTGSGKTISFMIPAIDSILKRRKLKDGRRIHRLEAIVVAPTRELAFQIMHEGRKLAEGTSVKVVVMRKRMRLLSTNAEDEEDETRDEVAAGEQDDDSAAELDEEHPKSAVTADILVTTPMLLLNYLLSGPKEVQTVLENVRHLILDEADVLLDPLFREQTMGIWTACTCPSLRLSFWSATMGSNIETLITETLSTRYRSTDSPRPLLLRLIVGLKDTAVPNVAHKLIYTGSEQGKLLAIRQLLHPTSGAADGPPLRPPFLVFTQTIERAAALRDELKYDIPAAAGGAARIAALHGALSDADRAAVMRRFRAGDVWVLATTDVLARGVDFAGVNGVVNYDVPGSAAAYVHRAGRTGRAGREGGVAVTLYTKEDIPFVRSVANVIAASERQAGRVAQEGAGVQKWLLNALPKVSKADRKMLKERGVEARRMGAAAKISSKSAWERRRDNNRKAAIAGSKGRKRAKQRTDGDGGDDSGWDGIGD